ncbi:MAG: zinc ribbon domain-containing protein [Clostridiales bacterium]|nr:zinc ribbon domain-containing protein [Clostridiales bacterium]
MYCTKCGAKLVDGCNFCDKCGAKQRVRLSTISKEQEQETLTIQKTQSEETVQLNKQDQQTTLKQGMNSIPNNDTNAYPEFEYNLNMAQSVGSQQPIGNQSAQQSNVYFNPSTGNAQNPWQSVTPVNNPNNSPYAMAISQPQKKDHKPKIFAAVIVGCLVVAIAALIITLFPKKDNNVYTNTIEALGKNLESGGFTMKIVGYDQNTTAKLKFNPKKSEIALLVQDDYTDDKFCLYKDTLMRVDDNENSYEINNIEDELNYLYRYYKYFDDISKISDIDFKKLCKEVNKDMYGEDYLDSIDFDKDMEQEIDEFVDGLKKIESKLNDKKYLEDNFLYTTTKSGKKTVYKFTINKKNVDELLAEDTNGDIEDLKEVAGDIGSNLSKVYVEITIEEGYLTEIHLVYQYRTVDVQEEYTISFSDFGTKNLDSMMDQLKDYYDNMIQLNRNWDD